MTGETNQVTIKLQEIAAEVAVCPDCELCRTRTLAVPGEGSHSAKILLIGEGPGWHEDQKGVPFVGAAGKFLTELLGFAGLAREDVFITNVVKCRPPGNRDPYPDEIAACSKYLDRQIEAINPDVIVTLGRFSMSRWFPGERISKIHGQPKREGGRMIVPMYHPAAALHQGALRVPIQEDFAKLPKMLDDLERERFKSAEPKAEDPLANQMKLF